MLRKVDQFLVSFYFLRLYKEVDWACVSISSIGCDVSSALRQLQYLAVGKCVARVTSQCPVDHVVEALRGE